MKVLLLSTSSDAGGGPQVVFDLAKGLMDGGADVEVALPAGGVFVQRFYDYEINTIELALDSISLSVVFKLWRHIRHDQIDLLHSHGKGAGLYARLVGFMLRIPVVHTHHGIFFERYNAVVKTVYVWYEKSLSLITKKVINVSKGQEELGIELGIFNKAKSAVIYNARSIDEFSPAEPKVRQLARKKLHNLEDEEIAFITVARLHAQKNHRRLLELFSMLVENTNSRLRLILVGGGELQASLKKQVSDLGLDDMVVFAGEQSSAKPYYDAADVYITASLVEGLPVTLIEAQLCGLPVLASNVVGNNEIVMDGENGYLYELENSDQFVEKATSLLDEKNRARMGVNGYGLARERFGMSEFIDNHLKLYRGIVGSDS